MGTRLPLIMLQVWKGKKINILFFDQLPGILKKGQKICLFL